MKAPNALLHRKVLRLTDRYQISKV